MSKESAAETASPIGSAPVFSLDPERVGTMLLRLGALSHVMGHEHVGGTVSPYLQHPELLSPEGRFVADILSHRPVDKIIAKWYGSDLEAALMVTAAIAQLHP